MRRWSWRVTKLAGIDVFVHATFLLILAWVAVAQGLLQGSWAGAVGGMAFLIGVFACVLLHELGHALAARRYGIKTRDIILLPIGGVARLERMPDRPGQEIVVALAGPAVNVVIAAVLGGWLFLTSSVASLQALWASTATVASQLLAINLFLVAFNLLPAFPMDGGRVLRALLVLRMGSVRGTNVAARIGQGMAVLFGIGGLMWNPFLLIIAVFIWMGAGQEARATAIKASLSGTTVGEAMTVGFATLRPSDDLDEARGLSRRGFQHVFPVVDGVWPVGLVTEQDLLSARRSWPEAKTVGEAMTPVDLVLRTEDQLAEVLPRLAESEAPCAAVVDGDGVLRGLLLPERVMSLSVQRLDRENRDAADRSRVLRRAG